MRRLAIIVSALVAFVSSNSEAKAQGVAGASLQGTVTASAHPVRGAVATLRNDSTGNVWRAVTSDRGSFRFDNLPVVGTFSLEIRAIGFRPDDSRGIVLRLGDRVVRDVALDAPSRRLDTVVVHAAGPEVDAGAGGTAKEISGDLARGLPLLNRNFVGLFALASQASGGSTPSIGGQHPKLNAILVDGGSAGDFFGVNITPGANNGARSVSLEAVQEIRILVSPFDVRDGGFTGGLINAVTRSGTNDTHVSAVGSITASDLVGNDATGDAPQRFSSTQYAFTAGGPIVRDRLHYFVAADAQAERGPAGSRVDVNDSIARRVADISRSVYQFDPGGTEAPTLHNPTWNLFTKVSWQASPNHLVDVSVTGLGARNDILGRSNANRVNRDGWGLSNSGAVDRTAATTARARIASGFGSLSNELMASWSTTVDRADSRTAVPLFLVQTDAPNTYVAAGSLKGAEGTRTDQRAIEITDNLSWTAGSHVLTLGTQNEFLHFHDNILVTSWGVWTFPSTQAYSLGRPSRYEVSIPQDPNAPLAEYSSLVLAAYAQDRWAVTPRLTLTAGLRVDAPTFDAPSRDTALANDVSLGRLDTSVFPSGNAVLSPRVGFSYQLGGGERAWVLRGGGGAFVARLPFVWMTNAYHDLATLVCDVSTGVPAPVTNVSALPSSCATSNTRAVATTSMFAANTRFPRAIKTDLGLDHALGHGIVASADVMVTRTNNSLTVLDRNLVAGGIDAEGRSMYGAFTATGLVRPARLDNAFGPVYYYQNTSGDRNWSASWNLSRQWSSSSLLEVGYTRSRTRDRNSLFAASSQLMFQNNPIEGTLDDRTLGRSNRDVPHALSAALVLPVEPGLTVSGFLQARSGSPFAYAASGDPNADGAAGNDLFYVPRSATDISLKDPTKYAALDSFIESEPCLRAQRGQIVARNSCRNPAVWNLDARVAKSIHGFEIGVDVFDLPNLLDHQWGVVRATAVNETAAIVSVAGWDAAARRPVYDFKQLPTRNAPVPGSAWRIQIGARQSF